MMTQLISITHRASLPRRRGRPRKTESSGRDCGTPELAAKKRTGENAEAIDMLLQRDWISMQQHWCGIHLRWLYTLRFGAPGVRAVDPAHMGGTEIQNTDPQWRAEREQEYLHAMHALVAKGADRVVKTVCIYNELPAGLAGIGVPASKQSLDFAPAMHSLRSGLDILQSIWQR
jgi:hypothetical protein